MSLQTAATDISLVGSYDAAVGHPPEKCGVEQHGNHIFGHDPVDVEKTRCLVQCQAQAGQFHELRGQLLCGGGTFAVTMHRNLRDEHNQSNDRATLVVAPPTFFLSRSSRRGESDSSQP
jgi:hypothetical protein